MSSCHGMNVDCLERVKLVLYLDSSRLTQVLLQFPYQAVGLMRNVQSYHFSIAHWSWHQNTSNWYDLPLQQWLRHCITLMGFSHQSMHNPNTPMTSSDSHSWLALISQLLFQHNGCMQLSGRKSLRLLLRTFLHVNTEDVIHVCRPRASSFYLLFKYLTFNTEPMQSSHAHDVCRVNYWEQCQL